MDLGLLTDEDDEEAEEEEDEDAVLDKTSSPASAASVAFTSTPTPTSASSARVAGSPVSRTELLSVGEAASPTAAGGWTKKGTRVGSEQTQL